MTPASTIDERTPVIVGVGQLNQRVDQGEPSYEPVALMAEALQLAATDAGDDRVLRDLDALRSVHVFSWRYRDPARLVAERLGLGDVATTFTGIGGNVPQMLLNQAARDIAAGDAELVAIIGAEAVRSRQSYRRAGEQPPWSTQDDSVAPDHLAGSTDDLVLAAEIAKGIGMPVQIYPLFESAWRASQGQSVAENQRAIAELWARFSQVAAANPHAWNRRGYTADELCSPEDGNRMVGFPYRKRLNSYESLDQGAAVVIASLGKARSLGLDPDSFVFPVAGTDGHDAPYCSNRASFSGSAAIRLAGRRALALAGVEADALDHVDLYSCFPSAVQIAAHEIGIDPTRELTVTGGLSFAGGPWSNYVTHSIATMTERLRATGGIGLVSANGGYLTKHAFGVYRTEPVPGAAPFAWESPQDEIDAEGTVELCEHHSGTATIEACTVMFDRDDQPERAIVTTRLDDGRRAWGLSADPSIMAAITTDELVGTTATLAEDDTFTI